MQLTRINSYKRERGAIRLGKAAELLGSKGLSPINASPQDLEESYRRFSELMDEA